MQTDIEQYEAFKILTQIESKQEQDEAEHLKLDSSALKNMFSLGIVCGKGSVVRIGNYKSNIFHWKSMM